MSTESTTEAVERLQPERQALADALEDMLQYKYPDKYAMGFALLSRLAAKGVAVVAAERAAPKVDVERLGFSDLLDVADALLRRYPPDTIVCSHHVKADPGAQTTAAIRDLVDSIRLDLAAARLADREWER